MERAVIGSGKRGGGGNDCVGEHRGGEDQRESCGSEAVREVGGSHFKSPVGYLWCPPETVPGLPNTLQEVCQT